MSLLVTKGLRAFGESAQPYLDRVLDKTRLADLPEEAIEQGYQPYVFEHAGAPNIFEYNLDAKRINAGNTPEGLYATAREGRAKNYLEELRRQGKEGQLYPLVTRAENVFVKGADKPNQQMIDAYRKKLIDRFGDRDTEYVEGKLNDFARSGEFFTDLTRKEKSDIYRAGGADALLDGEDLVSLYPEQMREIDAEFDTNLMQVNNLFASRPEAAIGGLLSASDFDEARAALDEEEGYQYYDILPIRKNLMGREQPYELALPNIIREPARALLNLSEQLETGERDPAKAMGLLF